jgi:hypothetical protein
MMNNPQNYQVLDRGLPFYILALSLLSVLTNGCISRVNPQYLYMGAPIVNEASVKFHLEEHAESGRILVDRKIRRESGKITITYYGISPPLFPENKSLRDLTIGIDPQDSIIVITDGKHTNTIWSRIVE